MTKTIVVPLDGSERAETALAPAAWLARGFGADLHLVTTTFAEDTSDDEEILRRAAAKVTDVEKRCDVLRHSFPAHGVLRAVDEDADAVLCLSTRGRTGIGALVLGSVSDELLREATVPVVLVGPNCRAPKPTGRHLVVCFGNSDGSDVVLPVAASWASDLGLDAQVVMVADAHQLASFHDETVARVEQAAEALRRAGVDATSHVSEGIHPAEKIVEFARSNDAALITLATQRGRGLSPNALGHVAAEVVREASSPVLVVPLNE